MPNPATEVKHDIGKIKDPSVIKDFSLQELTLLAKEIRKRIVDVVSINGGHIAPSLGTVELTLALLSVFDPIKDRVVWDVGHQSYAWKILTGRNERFDTLRSFGGISGFTNRDESPCDAFSTGHSSTSVSAALGLACARDLQGESGFCIAVIGDGALTGGMSFEALNHSGHLQKNKFLVVLNDNAMSISQNVGGLQEYMARMMASRPYNTLKQQIWDLSGTLPENLRRRFILGAQKLEESMMNILVPNIIFEDLGFKYVGPIDGHDVELVSTMLRRIKRHMVGPVLRGNQTAATFPQSGMPLPSRVGPFDANSGGRPAAAAAGASFGKSLVRWLKPIPNRGHHSRHGRWSGLASFEKKFPKHFFDVGIAEQHAVTLAAGMAARA